MKTDRLLLAALLPALGLGFAVLTATPAEATKEFARREQKDCSHCHISDKGAGPRNEKGREYEANGYRFGVKSWSNAANRGKFLRANAAYIATWYFESLRMLDDLEQREKLPGGLALVGGKKDRMKMFPKSWLRAAKAMLAKKSTRYRKNALEKFLVRLESQFPATSQGKEATKLLDGLAADPAIKPEVEKARRMEQVRVSFLQAKTELQLGNVAKGRPVLVAVKDDELLPEQYRKEAATLLAETPAPTEKRSD